MSDETDRDAASPPATPAGYACHTGEARSTEDVTVRDGNTPLWDRGAGSEPDTGQPPDDAIPSSGNAPD